MAGRARAAKRGTFSDCSANQLRRPKPPRMWKSGCASQNKEQSVAGKDGGPGVVGLSGSSSLCELGETARLMEMSRAQLKAAAENICFCLCCCAGRAQERAARTRGQERNGSVQVKGPWRAQCSVGLKFGEGGGAACCDLQAAAGAQWQSLRLFMFVQ